MKTFWVAAIVGMALIPQSARGADYLSASGRELFERYCVACHGLGAAGGGPAAIAMKVEVPDLRLLTQRNGGKFPSDQVTRIIDGRFMIGAHGIRTMPIWGENFARMEPGNPDAEKASQLLVKRLTQYLESLQLPPIRK